MDTHSRPPTGITARLWRRAEAADRQILKSLNAAAIPLLRISLGVVFVWFGILKIVGKTPVAELVADTVYWFDPSWVVPGLGTFEVAVGVGLLVARLMRVVLLLFVLQMLGTFLVLVIQPDIAFQDSNPLLLTTEGEFVVKNLVLLSAGLTVGSRLERLARRTE